MKYRKKPKPYIEATIRQLTPKFTKLLCLGQMPYITFSQKEIKMMNLKGKSRLRFYNGKCWIKRNIIWINPNLSTADEARNTLAHEMIHLRFPYLAHTKVFGQKVKELLAGRQFKPYKPKTQ